MYRLTFTINAANKIVEVVQVDLQSNDSESLVNLK